MRWLLLKDLQILKRSPLLSALLLLYPICVGCLLGFALSGGPSKPTVAVVNLVPPGSGQFTVGSETINLASYLSEFKKYTNPIFVNSVAQAKSDVESGKVLAALVLPADLVTKLQSAANFGGGALPSITVYYSTKDQLKANFIQTTIQSQLEAANTALAKRLATIAGSYVSIIVDGGQLSLFGKPVTILGLQKSETLVKQAIPQLPASSPYRTDLANVAKFARVAVANLNISGPILSSLASPLKIQLEGLGGRRVPLSTFSLAIAVALSVLFVTLLITAGSLALEREENTFRRLVPDLISPSGLVAEKVALGMIAAVVVGLILLIILTPFVSLAWHRVWLWLIALIVTGASFAALGVAIGGVARELRAASLLAFIMALPLALLALVPQGTVGSALYDIVSVVSAIFPFKAGLDALNAAINGGSFGVHILHLLILAAVFFVLARLSLRRFA